MADTPVPNSPPLPDIIRRYLNGESMQDLAKEHRVNRQTLYNWMLAETGPDYERIITQALVNRIAEADHLLETAPDQLGITRARELARYYRQDFERRRPKLYGQKTEVQQDTTIRVVIEPAKPVQLRTHISQPVDSNLLDIMPDSVSE